MTPAFGNTEPDYSDSPWYPISLRACPWRDTDHRQPGAYKGSTYCTWCDGFVAGAEERSGMMAERLEAIALALDAGMTACMVGDFDSKPQYEAETRARSLIALAQEALATPDRAAPPPSEEAPA